MVSQLILQFVLILINAFFAATEIAVISLNEKKVKAKAEDGDKKAKKMLKMIEEPTQFLSTIQIGITLAGFLGSAFAADNFADSLTSLIVTSFNVDESSIMLVDTVAVILITLILSYFTLVLGELVPKRLAMKHKERLAELVCGLITFLATILKPIIWFLSVSTNLVLRLFGVDPHEKEEHVSEEDIVLMLDASKDEGSIDNDDINYIKNVFRLDDLCAEDVMNPRKNMVMVKDTMTNEEILNIIKNEEYSRLPVYHKDLDDIVGIIHARDFLLNYHDPDFKLSDIIFEPYFAIESTHLNDLFKDMQNNHNHLVIIVNEYGETMGLVTMEDILEELVGEIWDESDEEVTNIEKIHDNTYRVNCAMPIEEFMEFFNLKLDEDSDVATVNGWIIENLGDMPKIGDSFTYENILVTIAKADKLMALEATVEKINDQTSDEG